MISPFVLAELDYLVPTRIGLNAEIAALEEVERSAYYLEPFAAGEVRAAKHLIERYGELGTGLADASNVVLAHRHFRTLAGQNSQPFRLLPLDP